MYEVQTEARSMLIFWTQENYIKPQLQHIRDMEALIFCRISAVCGHASSAPPYNNALHKASSMATICGESITNSAKDHTFPVLRNDRGHKHQGQSYQRKRQANDFTQWIFHLFNINTT
jgi:hypothetical protein